MTLDAEPSRKGLWVLGVGAVDQGIMGPFPGGQIGTWSPLPCWWVGKWKTDVIILRVPGRE